MSFSTMSAIPKKSLMLLSGRFHPELVEEVAKHHTTIGSYARTGADNMFVAPVTIGDGAYTGAGSVITDEIPPGALGISRGRQKNIEGYADRKK